MWFSCGTHECGARSDCCKERVAHAETRKKLESLEAAHATTKRELEMWKHNAGTAVTVAIERIQTQRDAALARVRELEGLKLGNYETGGAGIWLEVLLPKDTKYDSRLCNTLGEAMPRKEGE